MLKPRDEERVVELERKLGLLLPDRATALAALTHRSWVNEHRDEGREDNERLEFLGDAVVDLAVSHRLMERLPQAREGELSRLRATVVDEDGLAAVARRVGLGRLLLVGRGEEASGGRERSSLLADALEAVIGVVFLAGGLPAVLEVVDRLFVEPLGRACRATEARDPKTRLQEWAQGVVKALPRYRVVSEQGSEHLKVFCVEVELSGEVLGQGEGRSKKEAEQAAAVQALERIASRRAVANGTVTPPDRS